MSSGRPAIREGSSLKVSQVSKPRSELYSLAPSYSKCSDHYTRTIEVEVLSDREVVNTDHLFVVPFPVLPRFPVQGVSESFLPKLVCLLISVDTEWRTPAVPTSFPDTTGFVYIIFLAFKGIGSTG